MQKLTDNIYLLEGRNNGRFPQCHCLYIKDDVCALIDSAAGDEMLAPLIGRVEVLVNSHFHPDHVRGNGLFPRAHIVCHQDDKDGLVSFEGMLRYTGYDRFSAGKVAEIMKIVDHRPSRVDETFADKDILDFGRTKLRVIHTPGHTPGHCCFYEEKSGLLFGADIDLTRFGPWYAHEMSDIEQFILSMEKIIEINPGLFVSGHEEGIVDRSVAARLRDYAAVIGQREEQIVNELRVEQSLDELSRKCLIYPRHPHPQFFFRYFEWQMIKKHLTRLVRQQRVAVVNDKFIAIAK